MLMKSLLCLFTRLPRHLGALLALCCLLVPVARAVAPAGLQVASTTGLPALMLGGGAVMETQYVFWGPQWSWAGLDARAERKAAFSYQYDGASPRLGLKMQGEVAPLGADQLRWRWEFEAEADKPGVMGGGLSFRFNRLATRWLGEPEVLPGNQGLAWGRAGAGRIEIRFNPKPALVAMEKGGNEVRAWFYKDTIRPGRLAIEAVARVSLGAELLTRGLDERLAADASTWSPTAQLYKNNWPLDLAFLNDEDKPAGAKGFIRVQGEQLLRGDGQPVRFWGTNLTAGTLFGTPRQAVPEQARRLAGMGYNLVRLHHHDSYWVSPNIFGPKGATGGRLDEAQARKIDWWIKCLKEQGIYVWLDLHVQRQLTAAEGIQGFDEIAKGKPGADPKGYNYINPTIQEAMLDFAKDYLTRRSAETGLRAVEEPAIALVQITNENDLTHHYGNALLPDKPVPWHRERYMEEARRFAQNQGLPADKVWRSWEPGPSKIFLNDLEQRFHARFLRELRAWGLKVPVSTTSSWGQNPAFSLPALTVGDVVDAHSYGTEGWLELDPALHPTLLHWLHAARVVGKPSTVSEWNMEGRLRRDRHTLPLFVAATAAHQQMAALLSYADSQLAFSPNSPSSPWEGHADPVMALLMPPAALLYRQGLVAPARSAITWAPDGEALFGQNVSPLTSPLLRSAGEVGRLGVAMPATRALPWLAASPRLPGERRMADAQASVLPADATRVVSDTGEILRDWKEGVGTLRAPRVQAVTGRLEGRSFALGDVEVALDIPHATAVVASLDGQPIAAARRLLVAVCGRTDTDAKTRATRVEPVGGTLKIRAAQPVSVRAARTDGSRSQLRLRPVNGWILLDLDKITGQGALALELQATP